MANAEKGLFLQNIIAVIWDFDGTLSPQYMQEPLFRAYGVDSETFWAEVDALPAYYARTGIKVQRDTCYLGHLLSYVQHGRIPDLTNAKLREFGRELVFYPGIPEFLERLKDVARAPSFGESDLRVEHYVVSTGLAEMVRGSAIAPFLDGIWASEFIECSAPPGADLSGTPSSGPISQIAGFLDHTTKTRALFEINKGVIMAPSKTVNDSIPEAERRVPFKNMIYVADGPSDIPSFSVVHRQGGHTYAVYDPDSEKSFEQAVMLHENGRVHAYGPGDYREGSQTERWLRLQVRKIAERIMRERQEALSRRIGKGPVHLA